MSKQIKVAKALAKQLTAALSENGQNLTHSVALEVVAKAMGARNWHAFLAEQQAAPAPATLQNWSPAHGPMSSTQYLCAHGQACPVCGCPHELNSAAFESDGNDTWREVTCGFCSSGWREQFSLVGCEVVKRGDGATMPQEIADIGFLHAVRLWLSDGKVDFDIDNYYRQTTLDDLVLDRAMLCREMADNRAHGAYLLNSAVSETDQETMIEFSEARASDINNQGPMAQLQFLLKAMGSKEDFINLLAEQCEVPRDKLKL